jgi:hypothetical protein
MAKQISGEYTEEEIAERRDATIKRMLATPPTPHSEMKIGKFARTRKSNPKRTKAAKKL